MEITHACEVMAVFNAAVSIEPRLFSHGDLTGLSSGMCPNMVSIEPRLFSHGDANLVNAGTINVGGVSIEPRLFSHGDSRPSL